jgi:protein-S-isoprenylcysteine O-methyltransferase Ste14
VSLADTTTPALFGWLSGMHASRTYNGTKLFDRWMDMTTWVRGIIFTILGPGLLLVYIPYRMAHGSFSADFMYLAGWLMTGIGAVVYLSCVQQFLLHGGTPAIFLTRPFRFLIGEEPGQLVRSGLYKYSRNPMYLGALLLVFGEAVLFGSCAVMYYGIALAILIHFIVVYLEEPHLKKKGGASYDQYLAKVPRWFGLPKR